MRAFTSPLGPQIERFLAHKNALGFAYDREKAFLHEFDCFALREPNDFVSENLVRIYLSAFPPSTRPHRLTLTRQLTRFLLFEEPRTFMPPTRFLGIHRRSPVIRVLSREEASRFLDACDHLPQASSLARRVVHSAALRLLLLTGLRCGEALGLMNQDVDLNRSTLTVQGKYGKTRFVPIAADLTERLQDYHKTVTRQLKSSRPTDAFFPCPDGHRPTPRCSLYKSFRCVLRIAGIEHGGRGKGPRLHDARHSFAVLRLLTWYESDADLRTKLPQLATYLGHVGMTTSQVYLHLTRDLAGEVIRRQMSRFGDLITEVSP
jgi:integrase/recombinase XerD